MLLINIFIITTTVVFILFSSFPYFLSTSLLFLLAFQNVLLFFFMFQ